MLAGANPTTFLPASCLHNCYLLLALRFLWPSHSYKSALWQFRRLHAHLVGALRWPHDGRLPVKKVISDRSSGALRGGIAAEILKFL
jgi:hypothetical protein